jgi:hypothetical protein
MAAALIFEFDGVDKDLYDSVNEALGLDPGSGGGDWPKGIKTHVGAAKPGGLVVFEVWDSQADQDRFMNERLGPALQQAGVPAPSRVEWLEVAGYATPGG